MNVRPNVASRLPRLEHRSGSRATRAGGLPGLVAASGSSSTPTRVAAFFAAFVAILAGAVSATATYSIVARDPATGQVGAAVQSHWFKVKNVIWVEPGVGAVATQSLADYAYGPAGLELLRLGRGANEALTGLLASDTAPWFRQVAILDADGDIATHTGKSCIREAGHRTGTHYSVQANLMENDRVPAAMANAFETTDGDLAEKLLAALEAAQVEGGDIRGQQSAALLVAEPERTGRSWDDFVFDLRVDDHLHPVREMRRLVAVERAYHSMNAGDLAIERQDFEAAEAEYGRAMELAPGNAEVVFWYAVSLVNAGRPEDALGLFARTYALDPVWRRLPERLIDPGLLPDDPELLKRIENAGR